MEKRIVQFKGMTNVPDDGINEAGDMSVLMNAELKNGEILPAKKDKTVKLEDEYLVKNAKFHNGRLLELVGGKICVWDSWEKTDRNYELEKAFESVVVNNFEIVGNVVVMYGKDRVLSREDVYYTLWRNEMYEFLGILPMVPAMTVDKTRVDQKEYASMILQDAKSDLDSNGAKEYLVRFNKCINAHYERGRYIDNVLFIVGLRLFDGTYRFSHIYLIRDDEYVEYDSDGNYVGKATINPNFRIDYAKQSHPTYSFYFHVYGFETTFKFNFDFTKWKDVIESVEVFSSGSIMGHEVSTYAYQGYDVYSVKSIPKLRDEIEDCSTFYKVAKFNLRGEKTWGIDNTSPTNLAAQETLPVNNVKTVVQEKTFSYNKRLHGAGCRELINIATDNMFTWNGDFASGDGLVSEERPSMLTTKDGYSKVYYIKKWNTNKTSYMVSHPSRDVSAQSILLPGSKSEGFLFKEHKALDMAIWLNSEREKYDHWIDYSIWSAELGINGLTPFEFNPLAFHRKLLQPEYSEYRGYNRYRILMRPLGKGEETKAYIECGPLHSGNNIAVNFTNINQWGVIYENSTIDTLSLPIEIQIVIENREMYYTIDQIRARNYSVNLEEKPFPIEKNTLRVSALDNPFVFPETQTYMFEGEIVGMASNAMAVSQGQFGQYPLYVFTTEGIWAMQVDASGKTAYSTQSPISREVCVGEVVAFDKGVAFTTEKGVMAIFGGEVVELSAALDGLQNEMLVGSKELLNAIYGKGVKDGSMPIPVPIREYVKNAKLGYHYKDNKLLLFNETYGYAYMYDLKYGVWLMVEGKYITKVDNLGPKGELLLYDDSHRCAFALSDDARPVVAITRPFTLGSFDFKRLRQAALRTTFTGTLNFYLLGSNDGANFVCITGKEYPSKNGNESMNVTRRDLITAMSRSKQYKYFAIAIAGNMKGRVSLAELLVDAGFANNKLR